MPLDPTAGGRFPSPKSDSDNNKVDEGERAGATAKRDGSSADNHGAFTSAFSESNNSGAKDFGSGKSFVVGETGADFGSGKSFVSDNRDGANTSEKKGNKISGGSNTVVIGNGNVVSSSNSGIGGGRHGKNERIKQRLDDIKHDRELADFARKAELDEKISKAQSELKRALFGAAALIAMMALASLLLVPAFALIFGDDDEVGSNETSDVVMIDDVYSDGAKSDGTTDESDDAGEGEGASVGADSGEIDGKEPDAAAGAQVDLGRARLTGYLVPSSDGHYIVPVGDDMVAMHIVTTDKTEYAVMTCLCPYGEHGDVGRSGDWRTTFGSDPIMNGISFVQCENGEEPSASVWMGAYTRFRTKQPYVDNVFVQVHITQEDLDYLIQTCGETPATKGDKGSVQRIGIASDETLDWLKARGAKFGNPWLG